MIHPHTYIHPNAQLATNVKIDPFTVFIRMWKLVKEPGLVPMLRSWKVQGLERIAGFFPGAVIAAIPQDLKFEGEYSNVFIGDNTPSGNL